MKPASRKRYHELEEFSSQSEQSSVQQNAEEPGKKNNLEKSQLGIRKPVIELEALEKEFWLEVGKRNKVMRWAQKLVDHHAGALASMLNGKGLTLDCNASEAGGGEVKYELKGKEEDE